MMQQLLQAKSVGGGQQEEKSGDSGKGDVNDDSGGAGRAPRKEGATGTKFGGTTEIAEGGEMSSHSHRASDGSRPPDDMSRGPGTRVDATTETAAGEKTSSHSSRAADGSRPADNMGRRPEVPAGVGPILKNRDRSRSFVWLVPGTPPCPRRRGRSDRPGRPSKRFFRAKAAAGEVHDEVVAAVAGAPRAVAAAGTAIRVKVTAAEEAAVAPVVPAVVATATVADLMAAVRDATGGTTSGRSAPRRRGTSLPSMLDAWVLVTRRPHAHRTRRCWRWSCRCQKRISP